VVAGSVCLDRYEASVWRVPNPTTTNAILVSKIQFGRATQADLTAGGATQLGTAGDDYAPCTKNGQNCANDIYAVSLPSEIPSTNISLPPRCSVPRCPGLDESFSTTSAVYARRPSFHLRSGCVCRSCRPAGENIGYM
jgi:hypothetical protein